MKTNTKTALIIGVNGQDGRLLFEMLTESGYSIIGIGKKTIKTNKNNWAKKIDIDKQESVFDLIKKTKPDEIYYLAAFLFSAQDKRPDFYNDLKESYQVHVLSLLNFLEAVRLFSPKTKLFYAASSLMFGDCKTKRQTEATPFNPNTAYGLTKMDGTILCRFYREKYKIFTAVGIMYNHESKYRTDNFISMKIIKGAKNIASGKQKTLVIGDLYAVVDWGYAPDYVRAMTLILNLKRGDNFIIASGQTHSVLHLVKIAFTHYGLDYRKYIKENKSLITKKRNTLVGNAKKLKDASGWKPSVNFDEMINKIIKDLEK